MPQAILLVDDDEFMLDMLPRRLRRLFPDEATRILQARTPEEALGLVREHAQVHLVILSDFDLRATMTGLELLREVGRIAPASTRILFSGHTADEIGPTGEGVVHGFLEKPYKLDDLLPPFLDIIRSRAQA